MTNAMIFPYTIPVDISRDTVDTVSLIVNVILGITAIVSLLLSIKAFRRSEYDTAMNTSPSIIVRPVTYAVIMSANDTTTQYNEYNVGCILRKDIHSKRDITFYIIFECINEGRGAAFNVSPPKVTGMKVGDNKIPLYVTLKDKPFRVSITLNRTFDEFHKEALKKHPVKITLEYTNDQNNIYCRSTWEAKIRPFEIEGENIKVRQIRILERSGKIEYSQKPF